MQLEQVRPEEIEARSFEIITAELGARQWDPREALIIKRVIHTTADFDYADNLLFSADAVTAGFEALRQGSVIVTDTNMVKAGINKTVLAQWGGRVECYMADPQVMEQAKKEQRTRASVSMERAAEQLDDCIFAVGNAPTALLQLHQMIIAKKLRPKLIIAVPVGFVNVVQAKELIVSLEIPFIVAKGRKGGSNVAAAICNALLYQL